MTTQKKINLIMDHILTKEADLIKVTVGINRTGKFINFHALFRVSEFRFFLQGLSDLLEEINPDDDYSSYECYSRPLKPEEDFFPELLDDPIKDNQILVLDCDINI